MLISTAVFGELAYRVF